MLNIYQKPNLFNSCSIINPVINESAEFNSENLSVIQKQEKSLISNKIENWMGDLSHLMENLERKDNTVDKEPHFSNSALLNNTLNNQNTSNGMMNLSSSQNGNQVPNFNNFSNIKLNDKLSKNYHQKPKRHSIVDEKINEDDMKEEDSDVNILQILKNEENQDKEYEIFLEEK